MQIYTILVDPITLGIILACPIYPKHFIMCTNNVGSFVQNDSGGSCARTSHVMHTAWEMGTLCFELLLYLLIYQNVSR